MPRALDRDAVRGLLDAVRDTPAERIVNYFLLRAMAQAVYSTDDAGHFALASDNYCHFTSPIRRYADLTVHRMLDAVLRGRRDESGDLSELGGHLTSRERRALAAERAAKSLLVLQVMRRHLGETLAGVVTGVTTVGAFVQVQPFLADGLVRIQDFGPEQWFHDRDFGVLQASRSGRRVYVGLAVHVRVAAIDDIAEELVLVPHDVRAWGEPTSARAAAAAPTRSAKHGRPRRRGR
jgi:ribonuclease R